jgi:hypothetical protein
VPSPASGVADQIIRAHAATLSARFKSAHRLHRRVQRPVTQLAQGPLPPAIHCLTISYSTRMIAVGAYGNKVHAQDDCLEIRALSRAVNVTGRRHSTQATAEQPLDRRKAELGCKRFEAIGIQQWITRSHPAPGHSFGGDGAEGVPGKGEIDELRGFSSARCAEGAPFSGRSPGKRIGLGTLDEGNVQRRHLFD